MVGLAPVVCDVKAASIQHVRDCTAKDADNLLSKSFFQFRPTPIIKVSTYAKPANFHRALVDKNAQAETNEAIGTPNTAL